MLSRSLAWRRTPVLASVLSLAACGSTELEFVPGPELEADQVLFWVSEREGRLEWVRGDAGQPLSLQGEGLERFFYVLLRASELERLGPDVATDAGETVDLLERSESECTRSFALGLAGRRGYPLSAASPELRELDLESFEFVTSPEVERRLSVLAVDVPVTRNCAEPPLRVTEVAFLDPGRVELSVPIGAERAVTINNGGVMFSYELTPEVRILSRLSMNPNTINKYHAKVMQICRQDGRSMLYMPDQTETPDEVLAYGVRRFDITDGVLQTPELVSNEVVKDMAALEPSTCIGVGNNGLLVTSTSATSFTTGPTSAAASTFESLEVLMDGEPVHYLGSGDGSVYRGRVDEGRVQPVAQASAFGLRSLAVFPGPTGPEIWATDSNEQLNRLRSSDQFGTQVLEILRLPVEFPATCPARFDECGDPISSRGVSRVAGMVGPDGQHRLVIAVPNCPALIVADPKSLCSYGVDLSRFPSGVEEVRDLQSFGHFVWVSTEKAAFRLEWP